MAELSELRENLIKTVIKRLGAMPEDYKWCPRLDGEIYTKEKLINEVEKNTGAGKLFTEMITEGTKERIKRGLGEFRTLSPNDRDSAIADEKKIMTQTISRLEKEM